MENRDPRLNRSETYSQPVAPIVCTVEISKVILVLDDKKLEKQLDDEDILRKQLENSLQNSEWKFEELQLTLVC